MMSIDDFNSIAQKAIEEQCSRLLGVADNTNATDALIACLLDRNELIRRKAARLLAELGSERALEVLSEPLPGIVPEHSGHHRFQTSSCLSLPRLKEIVTNRATATLVEASHLGSNCLYCDKNRSQLEDIQKGRIDEGASLSLNMPGSLKFPWRKTTSRWGDRRFSLRGATSVCVISVLIIFGWVTVQKGIRRQHTLEPNFISIADGGSPEGPKYQRMFQDVIKESSTWRDARLPQPSDNSTVLGPRSVSRYRPSLLYPTGEPVLGEKVTVRWAPVPEVKEFRVTSSRKDRANPTAVPDVGPARTVPGNLSQCELNLKPGDWSVSVAAIPRKDLEADPRNSTSVSFRVLDASNQSQIAWAKHDFPGSDLALGTAYARLGMLDSAEHHLRALAAHQDMSDNRSAIELISRLLESIKAKRIIRNEATGHSSDGQQK